MADSPEVAEAKDRLRALVVPAVATLAELVESDHAGIRLGAAKEILDRGGVPARRDTHTTVDVTMDEEIEELLRSVKRQMAARNTPPEDDLANIEEAIVVQDPAELPLGEQLATGMQSPPEPVLVEEGTAPATARESAPWQAQPRV